MARIAIYIGRHLCTAPRALKEADALAAGGHSVSVHGYHWDPSLVARDAKLIRHRNWTFEPYAKGTSYQVVTWAMERLRHRIARFLYIWTGIVRPSVFGYGAIAMRRHALRNRADLTILHSETGLWTRPYLRNEGLRTGVDFEDWFSHDLSPAQQVGRPVKQLEMLETTAVNEDEYRITTSKGLSHALRGELARTGPSVVYNTLEFEEPTTPPVCDLGTPVAIHWFSQTIGPSRGLETLFAALPKVQGNWRLSLRGDDPIGFGVSLRDTLPSILRDRVEILPTVPMVELSRETANFDIGLSLEVSTIPSRDLTITNKIFQYLHSGLAIVASETAGSREILEAAPECGWLCDTTDQNALANLLSHLLQTPRIIERARLASLQAARTRFDHRQQIHLYQELAATALAAPCPVP